MSEKSKKFAIETWAINQSKWKSAREYAHKRNISFFIITDKDLYGIK